jgi:hypothetical protein
MQPLHDPDQGQEGAKDGKGNEAGLLAHHTQGDTGRRPIEIFGQAILQVAQHAHQQEQVRHDGPLVMTDKPPPVHKHRRDGHESHGHESAGLAQAFLHHQRRHGDQDGTNGSRQTGSHVAIAERSITSAVR